MASPLPPGFIEISPDRSVTTEELIQLNAVASEHRHLALMPEGERMLAAGAHHHGTVVMITDDAHEPPQQAHGGQRVHSDAWLICVWLLQLKEHRQPIFMGCRASAWYGLDPGVIEEDERRQLHQWAMKQLREKAARGLLIPNREGKHTPLVVADEAL